MRISRKDQLSLSQFCHCYSFQLVSLFWMQNESHILIISIQSQRFHWRMVEIDDSINKVEQKICTGNNNQFQHLHKHEEIIRLVINDRSSFSRHRVAFSPFFFIIPSPSQWHQVAARQRRNSAAVSTTVSKTNESEIIDPDSSSDKESID